MVDKGEAGLSRDKLGIDESCALAISNIVETACLLHDIGNPPFGHFGESAISNWFHGYWPEVLEKRFAGDASANRLAKDFQEFDGNPQGFRIITRVGGVDDFGMNLTVAQIASTVKYPVDPEGIGLSAVFSKKAGFFHSEGEHGKAVWEKLGLMSGARFPLAYLMEAADDISYCLSDIEDGIEKGYLRHQDFTDALIVGVEKDAEASAFVKKALEEAQRHQDSVDVVVLFRTKIITYLVERIARSYCENHERIFAGQTVELAQNDTPEHSILKAVRDVVADLLYGKRASHELELTGHAAMLGILRRYEGILNLKRGDAELLTRGGRPSKMLEEQAKLFSFLPKKHVDAYCRRAAGASDIDEWMARCHLVTDYISGMTDVFALRTYQMLSGIRV